MENWDMDKRSLGAWKAMKRYRHLFGLLFFVLWVGAATVVFAVHNSSTTSDLVVSKSVDNPHPLPDEIVTFSIQVFNTGVISATGGTVNDQLDGSLTFVGPVTIEGGGESAVTGEPPTLASGLTISPSTGVTLTFPVRVQSGLAAGTKIDNSATAASSEMAETASNIVTLTVAAPPAISWKQRSQGIDGGVINALAIDPQHTQRLYAGTPAGVFKSSDGGGSWAPASSGLPNMDVQVLALDPLQSDRLYAGTRGGVFKSSDGGATWAPANSGLSAGDVQGLVLDPGQPAILYAGTELGIFKSTDGGASWAEASAGLGGAAISALTIDPRHSSTLYAGTDGGGVYKSSDGGFSWAPANSGLGDLRILALQTHPLTPGTIYAGTAVGIYKSINGGQNWSAAGTDLAATAVLALAIDPTSEQIVYAGTPTGLAKSSNGGAGWSPLREGETKALAIDPFYPAAVYAGTAGDGVVKSSDGGSSWTAANDGLSGGRISALAIDPQDSNLIFSGSAGEGVYRSRDGGGSWTAVNEGLSNLQIRALAIPNGSSSLVYAGTSGGIFRSSDDGDNWNAANSGLSSTAVRTIAIHPSNETILYTGTAGGVFRSNNGGSSWSAASNGLTEPRVNTLVIDPLDPQVLYAGTQGGGVFKSGNGGSSWSAANSSLAISDVRALLVDPQDSQVLYAAGPGGIFKSSDGASSWQASGSGLDGALVVDLAFDPANSTVLYAATAEQGVFRSTGGGFHWTAVNEGLTVLRTRALALASANTVYAGTDGGGVYSSGPHLAVSKQVDILDPAPGDDIVYTIRITNTGTLSISSGTVTDNLDGKLSFDGPVTIAGGGPAALAGSPPTIAQNLLLPPGEAAVITLPVTVQTGLAHATTIPNTAVASAPELHSPASSEVITTIYRPNKLVVNQSVDIPNPRPGQLVTFSVTIKNIGGQAVGGIAVSDDLDERLTFVGPVTIVGSSGSTGSPPLIASGMTLGSGRSLTVKIPVRVNGDTLPGAVIDNVAEVTSVPWPIPISSQVSLTVDGPEARQIFVNGEASGGANDGTSWEDAYISLQDALLNAGSGSEIWVAAGTYYPDEGSAVSAGDPSATFYLRSGVALYGGFAGGESSLDERDQAANPTILSGDIDGNDGDDCQILPGAGHIQGTNSMHVLDGSHAGAGARLDGFTISSGHARGPLEPPHGGGIYIAGGSPALANLLFCGNKASGNGGALFVEAGSPSLNDIRFVNNTADRANGRGGAMAATKGSQPSLASIEFEDNAAYYGGAVFASGSNIKLSGAALDGNRAIWGGGIFNGAGSDGAFSQLTFTANSASGGGGMANQSSSPTVANATWAGNRASQWGGGFSTTGGGVSLINPVFSGNLAQAAEDGQQSWGGGLYIGGGQVDLANATVTGNWAAALGSRARDEGLGGGLFLAAGEAAVGNSIFWNNEGDRTPDFLVAGEGSAQIRSSRLEGCPQYAQCEGLVAGDPQFTRPIDPSTAPTSDGNFSLRPSSPLVDAGNNSLVPPGVSTDRAGEPRIYNGVVDMGAFELPIACPPSGLNRLYVDAAVGSGDNSGLDWDNALSELTHALTLADGCTGTRISEIWVAAGVYVPLDGLSAAEAEDASFHLVDGLAIYGGFAGDEWVLEERDWLENLTILSGDVGGDDVVDATGVVTETAKIVGGNSYHVVTSLDNDATAVLDGFIINGGQANGAAYGGKDSGGGIYNETSSPTLRHLTVQANMAGDGGGIANVAGSHPALSNVRVQANQALYFGGGIFNQGSNPSLTNTGLFDNHALAGAGLFNTISSPLIVNATVAGNHAGVGGAAVAGCELAVGCNARLAAEAAGSGGGMLNMNNSRPAIMNSIVWQNEDDQGAAGISNDASSIPLIGYSLVQGSGGSGEGWNGSAGFDQGHNIDADPLFFATGDWHLNPGSPAIDAGDNEANRSAYDLDGKPRITDGNDNGEAVIDMGAYESTLVALSVSVAADAATAKVGKTITFTTIVGNEGKVSLSEIEAVDARLGEVPLASTSLEPGESTSGTLAYTVQEEDIGTLVITVVVSGKSAAGATAAAEDTVAILVTPGVYYSFVPLIAR